MKSSLLRIALIVCLHHGRASILRNDALLSRMVSDFHKSPPPQPRVVTLMQRVLCKNFPSVPCEMIVGDDTLNGLIQRSIQQLKLKKLSLETTVPSHQLTMFPAVNSEELSRYLAVSNTGYFEGRRKPKPVKTWTAYDKPHKAYKSKVFAGHKNMKKFYPHKVKYKANAAQRKDFGGRSEDKLSMSVEEAHPPLTRKHQRSSYGRGPEDAPVWRIDYTKHGEPSLSRFDFGPRLKGKAWQAPGADDNTLERARKDVMHPDTYIKRGPVELNAEGLD